MAPADETLRRTPGKQRGVVLPFIAVGAGLLLAAVALVIDLGRLMLVRSELQSAADACALAAMQELNQTMGQLQRAERAGEFAASRVPRGFQNLPPEATSDAGTAVTFSTDGVATYATAGTNSSAANYRFARCQVTHPGLSSLIGTAIGATVGGQITAAATASARPSSRACVVPLALDVAVGGDPGATTAPWGFSRNNIYYLARPTYRHTELLNALGIASVAINPTNDLVSGTYTIRTVDLPAQAGTTPTSSDVAVHMARVGTGVCDIDTALPRLNQYAPLWQQTAQVDQLWPHWNARFGLYTAGTTLAPTTTSPGGTSVLPDLTGRAPDPPALTATRSGGLLGLVLTTINVFPVAETGNFLGSSAGRYQYDAGQRQATASSARPLDYRPVDASGAPSESGNHAAFGAANRRLAILPIFKQAGADLNRGDVVDYACVLLRRPIGQVPATQIASALLSVNVKLSNTSDRFRLSIAVEYLGRASDADSPCRTSGMPGAPGARGPLVATLIQ